jgi:hypothetical protein
MAIRMQQRRGTAEQWTDANPVLGPGEIGFEIDTNSFKIGDGVATWSQLDYFQNETTLGGSIDDYIPLTQRAAANGVATLDGNGQVPASQLAYVDQAVQDVIGLAPEDLNTLSELADAIGDDPNFFTNIQQSVEDAVTESKDYTDTQLGDYARGDGAVFTGSVILNANPTQALEAATKEYVDGVASNLHIHESVAAATTGNILISSGSNIPSIDGVTTFDGMRILVKDQTDPSQNGIFVLQSMGGTNYSTNRAPDYNSPAEIDAGDFVFVSGGTVNGSTGWVQTATVGAIGTDPIEFTQFSGAGTYIAGLGITLNGNTFAADTGVLATKSYVDNEIGTLTTDTQENIANTQENIDNLEVTVQGLASSLQTVETNTNTQISSIETDLGSLTTAVSSNTSDISNLTDDLSTVQGTLTTATNNISTLESELDAAVTNISNLTTTVSDNETALNNLSTTVTGHGSDIDTIVSTLGSTTGTEIGYLTGVTSSIQGQIDAKLDSGIASTTYAPINSPSFSGTVVLPSDTSIGNLSSTELGYLATVTSNVQDQLDEKAPSNAPTLNSPTFTGTPTGLTPGMVGLGNVDNTADIDKPVSTATQAALDLKADLSGATFSGNIIVDGDLTVNGTNFSASATSITIEDNLVQLAHENAANTVDLGLVVGYNDGSAKHAGIVRDVSDNRWKLFKGVTTEPATTVDFSEGSLDDLEVNNLKAVGVVFADGTQTKAGVPSLTEFVEKTSSYTLDDLDLRDGIVEMNSSSATTFTIPTNAALAWPVGASMDILGTGTGEVTIAGANGVTVNSTPGLKLRTQWSSATILKRSENSWIVYGDLKA